MAGLIAEPLGSTPRSDRTRKWRESDHQTCKPVGDEKVAPDDLRLARVELASIWFCRRHMDGASKADGPSSISTLG